MKDQEIEIVYSENEVKDSTLNYFHGNVLTADTVVRKYLHRNDKNEYLDLNPDHIHQRIAKELARVESKYPNPLSQEVIYSYLKDFSQIIPQGSPISAIGNKYHIQSTSNCFLGGGVDEKSDSYGGIMKADQEIVQIAKRRGGIGQDISGIRPKGAITKNSAKTSDGIGVFMERYSNSTNEVAQCIQEDQRVIVKGKGLTPIKEVQINDFVHTKVGWVKVLNTLKNTKEVYKIKTNNGYTIQTSLDHVFLTLENVYQVKEKPIKDIKIGEPIGILNIDSHNPEIEHVETIISTLTYDFLKSLDLVGESITYDLVLESEHLFWCEGFYVHNSGRRGALMLTCDVAHPDIYTFATIKNDDKKVTGANISIKLSKEFMDCASLNKDFYLRYPTNSTLPKDIEQMNLEYGELTKIGKQYIKRIKAKDLWDTINHSAWLRAEPGLLFWDTVIDKSPTTPYKDLGYLSVGTNPCFPSSEYLLTDKGYIKFGDLYKNGTDNIVVTDNRISYESDGEIEKPENWKIDISKTGTTNRHASSVFLTKKDADILEIKTSKGFKVKCTPDHHIATTQGMVEAKDLTPDHSILIPVLEATGSIINKLPETNLEILGLLSGLIAGDGTFDKHESRVHIDLWGEDRFRMKDLVCSLIDKLHTDLGGKSGINNKPLSKYYISDIESSSKIRISSMWLALVLEEFGFEKSTKFEVPQFVMNNSSTNVGKHYLSGLFYADGSFQGSKPSGYTVRLSQSNIGLLEQVQKVLHSNGMVFGIYKRRNERLSMLPDGKGGQTLYNCQADYELISLIGSAVKFRDTIGFVGDSIKESKMNVEHNFQVKNSFKDSIVSITECPKEDVYCIKEPVTRSIVVNGISARRCGEIVLSPYDSCRLFVVNLCYFVENKFTPKAYFNVDKYLSTVHVAQRLMDDLIDLELEAIDRIIAKVESDPEDWSIKQFEYDLWKRIRVTCENGRRTGLGITGLGDVLAMLNITYGSPESIDMTDLIYKNLAKGSYETSIRLASERGSFPVYSYDLEKDHEWLNSIINILEPEYQEMYKVTGRRNIACNTTAPTGTTSMMSLLGEVNGVKYFGTTSGIEPVFLIGYDRRTKIMTGSTDTPDFVDNLGVKWKTYTVYHSGVEMYKEISKDINLTSNPYVGSTSADIDWVNSVKLQGQAQTWVDHSISKTVNVPNNVTQELIANIYMTAYNVGCKGVTVYRDGCRSGVLVETNKNIVEELPQYDAPKRPEKVKAEIHFSHIDRSKWILIVGLIGDKPYELFGGIIPEELSISKTIKEGHLVKVKKGHYDLLDNDDKVIIKDICNTLNNTSYNFHTRMVSMTLRHGTPVQYLIDQLNRLADKEIGLYTFNKVVVRVLKKFIPDGFKSSGATCVECGSTNLAYQEGCLTCLDCGNSKC